MTTTDVAGVREGEILAGKYRVDRILGTGGMGVVVAAHHIDLDQKVAIKFLLPEVLGHQEAVMRFAREARAAVKIKSEHVAKVTDVGKLENGAPYMVMEYLDGSDLAAWLSQRGALAVEQAVEFVLQACEAIAEAHALGIVHRDLKPGNLFVIRRPDGVLSVKVLDFGISKTTGMVGSGGGGSMTKTSALMGSPLYMSPEQMQSSRDVDSRTDIWALGVILYELLTGGPPFVADTMPELVLRVVQGPPSAPMRTTRPDVPAGLDAVIVRCLERDRGRRYESVGAFASALLPFGPKRARASVERISGVLRAAGLSASALALPPSSDNETQVAAAGTAASWGKTAGPKGRSRLLAVGAVFALLTVGMVVWRMTKGGAAPVTPAAATGPEPAVSVPPPPVVAPVVTVAVPVEPAPAAPPAATAVAPLVTPSSAPPASALVRAAAAPVAQAKGKRAVTVAKPASPAVVAPAQPASPREPRPEPSKPNIFED